MLCLRILQAALVYVNTLMVQDVLADPTWAGRLTAEDRRGLAPLFWAHVAPYGSLASLRVLLIACDYLQLSRSGTLAGRLRSGCDQGSSSSRDQPLRLGAAVMART